MNNNLVLLTGGTGYVGGRLLKRLESLGVATRCLARRPEHLRSKVGPSVEVVAGDVLDGDSLPASFVGVHTAYYLVHSMGSAGSFEEQDRVGAQNFAQAARTAGVQRIVYLGGLGDEGESLSPHLRSRHEVGDILRASGIPVFEFRASIILGSGSLSFELIRALVERLPIMVLPRWVRVPAQPIAIDDVLRYLIAALELPPSQSRTFEIGGTDQVTYADLMRESRQRGLERWLIPVPVLTPYLSSLWLGLVTPVFARIGRKLIESIRHPTIVRDPAALAEFPIKPIGVQQAIADALRDEDQELAQTRWSDAMSSSGAAKSWFGVQFGPRLVDSRTLTVEASADEAFAPIQRIGGKTGWCCADWLWRLRGILDLLVGGVGLRRGRRDAELLCVGDTVDCWRVEAIDPNRLLRLSAEMKLPGRAWLEFEVTENEGKTTIRQTAIFDPIGLLGRIYWYVVIPLHQYVFAGMLRGIAEKTRSPTMLAGQPPRAGTWRQAVALAMFLAICLGTAVSGAALTNLSVGDWYATLVKPSWNPPNWIFGPVWTILYIGMAIAAWLVWRKQGLAGARLPLLLFALQLFFNAAWSALFFGLRDPGLALIDIGLLWLTILATMIAFRRVSPWAAALLAPYLAWVSFATALNGAIWSANG